MLKAFTVYESDAGWVWVINRKKAKLKNVPASGKSQSKDDAEKAANDYILLTHGIQPSQAPAAINTEATESTTEEITVVKAPFLTLVDANNAIHRYFHGMAELASPAGTPVNALFGWVRFLLSIVRNRRPGTQIAVVFDSDGPTFRHEWYPEYKANRRAKPPELLVQFPLCREVTRLLGLPIVAKEGFEADDIIGTLAAKHAGSVTIMSRDKDMGQLVDSRITQLDTISNKQLGPAEIEEKFGIRPDQVVDYLAICGDTTDNIPGVPGVGAKTAVRLLLEHGTLETILEKASSIQGAVGKKFATYSDQAILSKRLATICLEVPLDEIPLTPRQPDYQKLREFFKHHGFTSLLRDLPGTSQPTTNIESFRGPFAFLSTFAATPINYGGAIYASAQHLLSALMTTDKSMREKIRQAPGPAEAMKLAKSFVPRPDWEKIKLDVMREVMKRKFQLPDLRAKLITTKGRELINANTYHDTFWGVCNGEGENWLGRIIQEVRDGKQQH